MKGELHPTKNRAGGVKMLDTCTVWQHVCTLVAAAAAAARYPYTVDMTALFVFFKGFKGRVKTVGSGRVTCPDADPMREILKTSRPDPIRPDSTRDFFKIS